jgi:hypothetical protein
MSFDVVNALAPTVTEVEARAAFLADPRAALSAAGLEVPEWVQVVAIEGEAPVLSVTLPPMLADGELSEADLTGVAGGSGEGYCYCG